MFRTTDNNLLCFGSLIVSISRDGRVALQGELCTCVNYVVSIRLCCATHAHSLYWEIVAARGAWRLLAKCLRHKVRWRGRGRGKWVRVQMEQNFMESCVHVCPMLHQVGGHCATHTHFVLRDCCSSRFFKLMVRWTPHAARSQDRMRTSPEEKLKNTGR